MVIFPPHPAAADPTFCSYIHLPYFRYFTALRPTQCWGIGAATRLQPNWSASGNLAAINSELHTLPHNSHTHPANFDERGKRVAICTRHLCHLPTPLALISPLISCISPSPSRFQQSLPSVLLVNNNRLQGRPPSHLPSQFVTSLNIRNYRP